MGFVVSVAAAPEGKKAANTARLRGCSTPHDFKPLPPGPGEKTVRRYICTHCRGVVDASTVWGWAEGHAAGWAEGYAAGRAEAIAEFRAGAAGGWGAS